MTEIAAVRGSRTFGSRDRFGDLALGLDGDAVPGYGGRSRLRGPVGLTWWSEILLLAVLYALYSLVRNSVGDVSTIAFENATAILHLEDAWNLAFERGLNDWVQGSGVLAALVAVHYATLHFLVTPAVLVWLYRRRRAEYRVVSGALMATTAVALLGFYFMPTAPPRLMSGEDFVDVMSQTASWGWWPASGAPASDAISNQFAAMPSLHCAWALWCGIVLAVMVRRTWVRVVGVLYPLSTFFVVMGSGNHFLLDVLAGAVLLLVVGGVVVLGARQVQNRRTTAATA
ncbi:phosphatase PAP2 family protein [Trujillonella endophytica]|uniref:PAP2 superfamily protein n=1 Tax=Trujillonella endophytica TaxID=673521 RepID=A0A1H8VIG3_9ACTN|nr:phosphatase PAP2 family protein [Trujillella endophytica]SEP15205.1 PAP2 superfamily protein [Trujillella endophytica]